MKLVIFCLLLISLSACENCGILQTNNVTTTSSYQEPPSSRPPIPHFEPNDNDKNKKNKIKL